MAANLLLSLAAEGKLENLFDMLVYVAPKKWLGNEAGEAAVERCEHSTARTP